MSKLPSNNARAKAPAKMADSSVSAMVKLGTRRVREPRKGETQKIPSAKKDGRVSIRVKAEHKALIQAAAALSGMDVTDYLMSRILSDARSVVDKAANTVLSMEAFDRFSALIDNPPNPTSSLVAAGKRYKKLLQH